RARVLVNPAGTALVELSPIPTMPESVPLIRLAEQPLNAPAPFLRHKTTRRDHYERFQPQPSVFDTLLWNAHGEVTEFTRGNVIVEVSVGRRVTPPLDCGLLDGVGRACELAAGRIEERV